METYSHTRYLKRIPHSPTALSGIQGSELDLDSNIRGDALTPHLSPTNPYFLKRSWRGEEEVGINDNQIAAFVCFEVKTIRQISTDRPPDLRARHKLPTMVI